MADKDDDSYSGSSSDAKQPAESSSTDTDEEIEQLEVRRSARKRSLSPAPAKSARMPDTERKLNPMLSHVSKRLKGTDISSNLSLRIVGASLQLKIDYVRKLKKASTEKKKSIAKPNIRETVCRLFRVSTHTYGAIMREYLLKKNNKRIVYSSGVEGQGRAGNRLAKDTRIPRTEQLRIEVRDYVRSRRQKRERVTGRQVLDYLVEKKYVDIATNSEGVYEKKAFETAYRNTRRWLQEFGGYKRGRRKNIVTSPDLKWFTKD